MIFLKLFHFSVSSHSIPVHLLSPFKLPNNTGYKRLSVAAWGIQICGSKITWSLFKNKDLEALLQRCSFNSYKDHLKSGLFFFFNQHSPTSPLQAILMWLILGPLVAQNSLRQVLDEIWIQILSPAIHEACEFDTCFANCLWDQLYHL